MLEGFWELEGEGELLTWQGQGEDQVSDDLLAIPGVGGEHTIIPRGVEVRGGDQGGEAGEEVHGVEDDGGGAILEELLELVADLSGVRDAEAVVAQGGACDVADEPLDASAVDPGLGVDVDALDLGQQGGTGVGGQWRWRVHEAQG